jgi:hypothetical protein
MPLAKLGVAGDEQHRLHHQKHEIDAVGPVFADSPVEARAGGIEVAQADLSQSRRGAEPAKDLFDHCLGLCVDALGLDSFGFGDRHNCRCPVYGARRRGEQPEGREPNENLCIPRRLPQELKIGTFDGSDPSLPWL